MWSSNSIFKNCQISRFFENLSISEGFWFQLSSWASDAIFAAVSNIASLLRVFNKNVVFQQQMLIFHVNIVLFMQKIEKLTKKQHLLLKNNTFVENQQQWCYVVLHIIYSIMILLNPSKCFAQFFDSCFRYIPGGFTKENKKWISIVNPQESTKNTSQKLSKVYARVSEGPDDINDVQGNITSLLLVFNKSVVFQQQILFFSLIVRILPE